MDEKQRARHRIPSRAKHKPDVVRRLRAARDALVDFDGLVYEAAGGDDGSLTKIIASLNKILTR